MFRIFVQPTSVTPSVGNVWLNMRNPNRKKKGRIEKKVAIIFLSLGVLFFPGSIITGKPLNRIGYNIGYLSNNYSIEFTDGVTREFKSSGLGLGVDAQFLATETVTLNPFLMISKENSDLAGLNFFNVFGGLQARYWIDRYFIGTSLAYYMTVISGGNTTSYVGPGVGINGGWENPNGFFISLRLDKAFHGAEQAGYSIHLGFRWKLDH